MSWKLKEIRSVGELLKNPNKLEEELHKPYSYGSLWVYVYEENFKLIKKMCGGLRGKRVLDVGCGGGWLMERLSGEGASVYGMDISPDFCKLAQIRSKLREFDCEIICGDGETLPFRRGAFDVLIIYASLHHFPDFKAGLDEALRVASEVVVADEPCKIPGFNFFFIKLLRDKVFKRREYSGVQGHRFNLGTLKRMFTSRGYAVASRRIWSYIPQGLGDSTFAYVAYKVAHRILMKLFEPWGHAFVMVINRHT